MKNRKLYFIAILTATIVFTGCYRHHPTIWGSGDIITQTLELEEFTGINMLGAEEVVISYGEEQFVEVTGHENIIGRILTDVNNGSWDMELEPGNYRDYELTYYITLPQINKIHNDGAAKVWMNDFTNTGDLDISINGAGQIDLNFLDGVKNLYITVDGAGLIQVRDEIPDLEYLDILIEGAGTYKGYVAQTFDCLVDITGTGKCNVNVIDNLEVYISGAGVVNYKGNPTVIQHISGLGTVKQQN